MSQITKLTSSQVLNQTQCNRETFIITSPYSTLNFSQRYDNVLGLSIERMIYVTASSNNYCLLINLSGFISEHRFVTKNSSNPYTKMILIGTASGTEVDYEKYPNEIDIITDYGGTISSNSLELTITGIGDNIGANSNDINVNNPLFLEIGIYKKI